MNNTKRLVLVTGANGFIGKNLIVRLGELSDFEVATYVREDDPSILGALIAKVDAVIHLAGVNRPVDSADFASVNTDLTVTLCAALQHEFITSGRKLTLVLASSIQAEKDNLYGQSKFAAEQAVQSLAAAVGNPVVIFRFPGVFGKWCRANYNSVVSTFCYNIARGYSIQINDPQLELRLVYVDDVVTALIASLDARPGVTKGLVEPEYTTTLSDLAQQIQSFDSCRSTLTTERVGTGLVRALYATYVSYLPKERFSYEVPVHRDERGLFVEILKTPDCGQFSFFTVNPGKTRGGHYHHTKSEKFLVIKGRALFRFRHLLTDELFELHTSGDKPQIVDTIPGWSHDITNIGNDEMVVMLWANENFDRQRPDTVTSKI